MESLSFIFKDSKEWIVVSFRYVLYSFLLTFIPALFFPYEAQNLVNSYTLMLPAFNIISEYAPIIFYDPIKVFAFIILNNLLVLGVIYIIGRFGLALFHSISFGLLLGALAGAWLHLDPMQLPSLLVYSSFEAVTYILAVAVMMRAAEKAYNIKGFKKHILRLINVGLPKKKHSFRGTLHFILFINLPLIIIGALIETLLIIGAL